MAREPCFALSSSTSRPTGMMLKIVGIKSTVMTVATAALLLGGQTFAQSARPAPSMRTQSNRVPAQTQAPAAQTGQQGAAASTQGAQMPEEYKRKLDALHERNLGRIVVPPGNRLSTE